MITPHFEVSQDADFVEIRIRVPHLRMEDGEFYVQEHEFKFHLRPYFLRLTFRQLLTEDGRETASYDAAAGVLTVRIPKATPGEHFDDLGMLSELLRKPERAAARRGGPMIEVLSSTDNADGEEGEEGGDDDLDEAIAADAEVEQALPCVDALCGRVRYGFNDAYTGVFVGLEAEGVVQLREPERAEPRERRAARLEAEEAAFDADHYIADLMDDEQVQAALRYQPWWCLPPPAGTRAGGAAGDDAGGEAEGASNGAAGGVAGGEAAAERARPHDDEGEGVWLPLGSEEQQQLLQLPLKEFLMGAAQAQRARCGLADLLFAYCYDARTTEGGASRWKLRAAPPG
eukprot:Transcript_14178.p1 GENE.Transcript_14178~~Transcript_14178.p1  ORF type:complete len:359 (+),score=139.52 Transcript_14178:46-1077(+)